MKNNKSVVFLRERVCLLQKKWKEQDDGSFIKVIQNFGEVWMRFSPIKANNFEQNDKFFSVRRKYPKVLYRIVMQKYFDSIDRHAIINALRWKCRVLDILRCMQVSEDGRWFDGFAADYGEEGAENG